MAPGSQDAETVADAEKCVRFLQNLECRWSGASRSRAIIKNLLKDYCEKESMAAHPSTNDDMMSTRLFGQNKRTFAEFQGSSDDQAGALWQDMSWSEMLSFDAGEIGLGWDDV
jgi:hypothetical protein